mmetsp:Transcript_19442/g.41021  ORF Transcript_19442/g.41021 Transcript_19442/m.41021 type:complete len:257 (-) Transcript_19442:238-1008(-)
MDVKLVDAEKNLDSFFTELQTEIDDCREKVQDLRNGLRTTRMTFDAYRRDKESKLAEQRRREKLLGREILSLQLKSKENGNIKNASAANHNEKIKSTYEHLNENGNVKKDECDNTKMKNQVGLQHHSIDMTSQFSKSTASAGSSNCSYCTTGTSASSEAKADKFRRQRIIHLRHAARCTAEDGHCTVSRHCVEMKHVWNHIMNDGCSDPKCSVKHCLSSRYAISHYQRRKAKSSHAISSNFKDSPKKNESEASNIV